MSLFLRFHEVIVNMLSAKLRSFLAILGVLVGTASVVALISSSQLGMAHALAQFESLGTNLLSLSLYNHQNTVRTEQITQLTLSDMPILKKSSRQIVEIVPYTHVSRNSYYEGVDLRAEIIGVSNTFGVIAKVHMARGRFISFLDQNNLFCIIGSKIADKILKTGVDPMGKQIRVGNNFLTVIGVMKPWLMNVFVAADLNRSIIIPLKTSYFLDNHASIDHLLIRLIQKPNIVLAKKDITKTLQDLLPQKETFFMSPEQIIHAIAKSRETYNLLLIAIGSISLVVGGIGVMNIMLVSVVERRREIGVRMAMGARQLDILRLFLIESVLLTMFGGMVGVIIGVLTSFILAKFAGWQFHLYLLPIWLGLMVSILVGMISGFYPAWRASKLNPIETLQSA